MFHLRTLSIPPDIQQIRHQSTQTIHRQIQVLWTRQKVHSLAIQGMLSNLNPDIHQLSIHLHRCSRLSWQHNHNNRRL